METEVAIDAGEELSMRQQTLLRLTVLQATNAAEQVVTWAYRLGGGVALRVSQLQRCIRDIHAATQHIFIGDSF